MPGRFRKPGKVQLGKYKEGVVPKLPTIPGHEIERLPENAHFGGALYADPKTHEVVDMPAYLHIKGKHYFTHARHESTGKWSYGHWPVDEQGQAITISEHSPEVRTARTDEAAYDTAEEALEAARKHLKQINEEED